MAYATRGCRPVVMFPPGRRAVFSTRHATSWTGRFAGRLAHGMHRPGPAMDAPCNQRAPCGNKPMSLCMAGGPCSDPPHCGCQATHRRATCCLHQNKAAALKQVPLLRAAANGFPGSRCVAGVSADCRLLPRARTVLSWHHVQKIKNARACTSESGSQQCQLTPRCRPALAAAVRRICVSKGI